MINQSIKLLNKLHVPISKKCYFDVSHAERELGWCKKHKNKNYIALNSSIINDYDYISTAIHELIHTIPNNGYSSHKGNWKYWANYVTNNTQYKIMYVVKLH